MPNDTLSEEKRLSMPQRLRESANGCEGFDHEARLMSDAADELERLRAGFQLMAEDPYRMMNETARQTAASILAGKHIGEWHGR